MRRPEPAVGPRSLTRHVVDAPFPGRVTLTTVPRGRVRWAHVPSGALNHEATPLSVLVTALETAAAGGTTFSSRVVSGVSGVVLDVVAGAPVAGARAVVLVVDAGAGVEVGAGLRIVVGVVARVVGVAGDARSWRTRSGREMGAASATALSSSTGPSTAGASTPGDWTPIAVDLAGVTVRRLATPATRVTMHSTATYDDPLFTAVPVSRFPASQPPASVPTRWLVEGTRRL